MKGAAFVALGLALATTPGFAQPKHSILVLKADGNADGKTRAKVDAEVFRLAKASADGQVTAGDISYIDAATAAGCKPEVPACKDEVLATFATDEIVIATVTRKPGTLDVSVRRATKGQVGREVTAKLASDADVQLESVGVISGAVAPVTPVVPVGPRPPPIGPQPSEPTVVKPVVTTPTVIDKPNDPTAAKPLVTAEVPAAGPPLDDHGPVDQPPRSRRGLFAAGIVGGGVFALIGIGLWGSAGDVQDQIDAAPKRSKSDFTKLKDLEARGDKLASAGNVMFVIGAGIAIGVTTYLLVTKHRTTTHHAMITPTVFDHGGGIALTFGGTP